MITSSEKKSVLLLDDDKFLLDMYSMKFVQQGFDVQAFLSAKDALQALRGGFVPDIILFDLVMPEHDGMSFIVTMQEEKLASEAIKIALTNQYDDVEREKVLELGADQCILKASAIPSEVVNIVIQAISAKRKAG
ncbi:MAG: response regulator [bacterium]|nr:response regulator [bacterium]